MYNTYFGFTEKPFTIAPNPRYLFMSERHQEALAHMLYGMQGEGGVMVLTGEVGTGKTTICRSMLEQVPEHTNIAYIINPKLTALELLASICDELHIDYPSMHSIKVLTDLLNEHLLNSHAKGLHTVVIIDEAQNLDASVLEQLRLLTNLETNDKKLLQIMLLGQPELAEMLQRNELRQLAQRITARYHLTPLDKHEVSAYLNHRLAVAGCENQQLFSTSLVRQLFAYTNGIPRLINLIADRALLGAYASESKQVNKTILKQAYLEVCGTSSTNTEANVPWLYLVAALFVLMIGGVSYFSTHPLDKTPSLASTIKTKPVIVTPSPSIQVEITPTPVEEVKPSPPQPPENIIFPFEHSQDLAFKAVFAAWDIAYEPARDGSACDFAKEHQLQCLRQRDNLAQMRSLNRPAVLTVSDELGGQAFVAITTLKGTTAIVQTGSSTYEIPLSQLLLQSHNDFTILWRAPIGYSGPVRPGHQGELVQLLAKQCTTVLNQQWIGAPRTKYDQGLKEQVKSFQRIQGLNPDGVAGPITWIHINSLTQNDMPTLQQSLESPVPPMDVYTN